MCPRSTDRQGRNATTPSHMGFLGRLRRLLAAKDYAADQLEARACAETILDAAGESCPQGFALSRAALRHVSADTESRTRFVEAISVVFPPARTALGPPWEVAALASALRTSLGGPSLQALRVYTALVVAYNCLIAASWSRSLEWLGLWTPWHVEELGTYEEDAEAFVRVCAAATTTPHDVFGAEAFGGGPRSPVRVLDSVLRMARSPLARGRESRALRRYGGAEVGGQGIDAAFQGAVRNAPMRADAWELAKSLRVYLVTGALRLRRSWWKCKVSGMGASER